MKALLKLGKDLDMTLEVRAENDVEAIALKLWSELHTEDKVAARLLVVYNNNADALESKED